MLSKKFFTACIFTLTLSIFSLSFIPSTYAVKPEITIYTSMYEDIIEAMTKTLKAKFPDYDIKFFYGGTGTLQAKIAAERETNKLGCDIFMGADPSYMLELKELGMLHPFKSKFANELAFEYDPDGYWYPVRNLNMILAYNPEIFDKKDLPKSFKDFAYDKTLNGLISMPNPLTAGTALVAISALKNKYGYEYFDKLAENHVMVESGSVALTKLETGECKVVMILEESVLKKREEEDSELSVIYPEDGVICIPSPIAIINDHWSAHSYADVCEEIADWFLSPEGQTYIVSGWMHSVLKNPPAIPYNSINTADIVKNSMPVDWQKCLDERAELRINFEEHVKK